MEPWTVRVVASCAEHNPLFTIPVAYPFSMDAGLPVLEHIPMALIAQEIGFREADTVAVDEFQPVPVFSVVTVKAPALRFAMPLYRDIIMKRKLPLLQIRLHASMTVRTGEEGRREDPRRIESDSLIAAGRDISCERKTDRKQDCRNHDAYTEF